MKRNKEYYEQLGKALKSLRVLSGLTQEQLGDILGVSFQQVQKYENGVNRIPVHALLTFLDKVLEKDNKNAFWLADPMLLLRLLPIINLKENKMKVLNQLVISIFEAVKNTQNEDDFLTYMAENIETMRGEGQNRMVA